MTLRDSVGRQCGLEAQIALEQNRQTELLQSACFAQQVVEREGAFFDLCGNVVQRQFIVGEGGARKHETEPLLAGWRQDSSGTAIAPPPPVERRAIVVAMDGGRMA